MPCSQELDTQDKGLFIAVELAKLPFNKQKYLFLTVKVSILTVPR